MSDGQSAGRVTRGGKFLTFELRGEEYAIRIENVREIMPVAPITRVPGTPDVVLGVINLRGKIVPVFDMHRKLGMIPGENTRNTCIVVTTVGSAEIGMVVDRVREVVSIAAEQIEPTPGFGADVAVEHLLGIATTHTGSARLLLAIDTILTSSEVLDLASRISERNAA